MIFPDDVRFEEKPVKISPSNPELPTITPVAFKVSGKVSSITKTSLQNRKILIKNVSSNEQQEIEVDPNTGGWTVYLAPAKYQLNVIVSGEEKTKGLQYVAILVLPITQYSDGYLEKKTYHYHRFFPLQRVFDVTSSPLKDINFLQLKATLKGTIVCLPDKDSKGECGQTQVTLKMIDGVVETKTVKAKGDASTYFYI